jgi:hypothetical protein
MGVNKMFAKRLVFAFCLLFLLLIIWGCPYDSSVSLGKIENSVIDSNLIGSWKSSGTDVDTFEVMKVYPFNQHEYLILFLEKSEINVFRAFSTAVNGHTFLNVNELSSEITSAPNYIFVEYLLAGNELKFRFIEDKLPKEHYKDSRSFYNFVKRHLNNDELFGEYETLVRIPD